MKVLVTGGAGYIGSAICSMLIDNGHMPIILDNFSVGRREFVEGRVFYEGDIVDSDIIKKIKTEHPEIESCVHCAAFMVVPESVVSPYEYYTENVAKSIELFKSLNANGINKVLFSSSASIYDDVDSFVVDESSPLNPRSPYARTKYMMEMVLKDFCAAYNMQGISLRYFNPIGNDPQLRSGIYHKDPTLVLGRLLYTVENEGAIFTVTGTDWPTRDGSGIRDYIHLWDLASAHISALLSFDSIFNNKAGYEVINIGCGDGVTVIELLRAFENVYGKKLNVEYAGPRQGDVAGCYTDAKKAKEMLNWQAQYTIEDAIDSALKWIYHRKNVIKY